MEKPLTAFVGLSHLGLVTSTCWATLKPPVIGIDDNKEVVESLKSGKILIMEDGVKLNEPGLPELFKKVKRNYFPTTDFSEVANCELVFIARDTPKVGKNPQNQILKLINLAMPYFRENITIVIMSQVPIGFCRNVLNIIQKKRPELSFSLYHWVDTIVMTQALERFLHPERIIIGVDNYSLPLNPIISKALKLFSCTIFKMSYESAELTKAAINFYLANSVTFANTLADFCEVTGANINEIIPALQTDKRIGPYSYIRPSLRIAGGHLERDLFMLNRVAKQKRISSGSVGFILKQNNKRYKWALGKIKLNLKKKNPTICIWGLSYKKNTTSTKNAPSLEIIKNLSGKARLRTYDPMAILPPNINGYTRYKDKYQALKGAHCLLILSDWDEFQKNHISKMKELMKNYLIIDAVGILEKNKMKISGFNYFSIGVGQQLL